MNFELGNDGVYACNFLATALKDVFEKAGKMKER